MSCVYDCRHELWGGDGICDEENEYGLAECSCDAGFISRDALGHASCVPKRVLVRAYIVVTIASFLGTVRLIWHINQYCHLPERCRGAKKNRTRITALIAMG